MKHGCAKPEWVPLPWAVRLRRHIPIVTMNDQWKPLRNERDLLTNFIEEQVF
jgi:hypothetical protein